MRSGPLSITAWRPRATAGASHGVVAGLLEGGGDLPVPDGELRPATDELLRLEKDGIREYKLLAKESSGYYNGLFKVLLDAMIRDSEKHVELLEFLKKHLKRT